MLQRYRKEQGSGLQIGQSRDQERLLRKPEERTLQEKYIYLPTLYKI